MPLPLIYNASLSFGSQITVIEFPVDLWTVIAFYWACSEVSFRCSKKIRYSDFAGLRYEQTLLLMTYTVLSWNVLTRVLFGWHQRRIFIVYSQQQLTIKRWVLMIIKYNLSIDNNGHRSKWYSQGTNKTRAKQIGTFLCVSMQYWFVQWHRSEVIVVIRKARLYVLIYF